MEESSLSHVPTNLTRRLVAAIAAPAALLFALATDAQAATSGNPHRWLPNRHRAHSQTAWTEQVVYSFQTGSDGASPWGDVFPAGGGLYSTTLLGGAAGMGTVFKLMPGRSGFSESIVHSFVGGTDGAYPWMGLSADLLGTLYGTTSAGGNTNAGTVYKMTYKGQSTIYGFQGGSDGSYPSGFTNIDLLGDVYGTTENGGSAGQGTVFMLKPSWSGGYSEQLLYSFQGGNDGANPHGGLLQDLSGSLYGTTVAGGPSGAGTVFKLAPSWSGGWKETVLHSFVGSDGNIPNASLIEDVRGTLYGTATWGGNGTCPNSYGPFGGCGTVFKLTPQWNGTYTTTTLYQFQGGSNDGGGPNGPLFMDGHGNLYGTTYYGGVNNVGTAFMLTRQGDGSYSESVIWNFGGSGDGAHPAASLVSLGNALYGTTVSGGANGRGTVFQLSP